MLVGLQLGAIGRRVPESETALLAKGTHYFGNQLCPFAQVCCCKALRSVALGWVGLGWVGLGWVGLGWVGLGWVGLGWVGWRVAWAVCRCHRCPRRCFCSRRCQCDCRYHCLLSARSPQRTFLALAEKGVVGDVDYVHIDLGTYVQGRIVAVRAPHRRIYSAFTRAVVAYALPLPHAVCRAGSSKPAWYKVRGLHGVNPSAYPTAQPLQLQECMCLH